MKLAYLIISIFLFTSVCLADNEVVIQDGSGNVRAQSQLDENGQVEVELTDGSGAPIDGVEVTLTNTVTGEVIKDISTAGLVVFSNVAPGIWVVSSSSAGAVIGAVSVGSIAAGAAVAGGAGAAAGGLGLGTVGTGVAAAAAVTGGTVAVAAATDNNNNNSPLSPFN